MTSCPGYATAMFAEVQVQVQKEYELHRGVSKAKGKIQKKKGKLSNPFQCYAKMTIANLRVPFFK